MPAARLVPDAMSTTLFTIAGMEQFVPVFLGREPAPAPRVVTVQPCLRVAGGKNDLENVGRSGRHGTFLEMLGNFSFGEYYKREAILWAWEFLTAILRLPAQRLFATVYVDDDEAAAIWQTDVGLDAAKVTRFREDNFWDMGPTGPCGPCSEIFYDLGPTVGCGRPDCGVGCAHCDRYIEVWNLVFQQYDRDATGTLHPLPRTGIDTGMGFERLCMVLAGKTSIFDTDLYQDIIASLPEPVEDCELEQADQAVHRRIIADHARAAVFLAADGVSPSNTDRGYVMRFLMRRALRSGRRLRLPDGFFSELTRAVTATLADGYPRLREAQEWTRRLFTEEERLFDRTLARGEARLSTLLSEHAGRALAGRDIFELHDTFGFPPELTAEIARERGVEPDMAGYRVCMDEQRERARRDAASKRAAVRVESAERVDLPDSEFIGYEQLEARARVLAVYDESGRSISGLFAGQQGAIVLDQTPFYAERGGQAGDRGVIARDGAAFDVSDTQYQDKSHRRVLHAGRLSSGALSAGDSVEAIVDPHWRREIRRHHTVTHLLQRALKDVLGEGVAQRGSAVSPDRTRFDFDAPGGALRKAHAAAVETRVNELIRSDFHRDVRIQPFEAAVAQGAIFMKGEQYGQEVRVVTFGPSVELCGGTHVRSTGEIGHFVLASESAIAAGIRRVEGLVSEAADRYVARIRHAAEEAGSVLTATVDGLPESVARLVHERRELEKRLKTSQEQLASAQAEAYLQAAQQVGDVPYLAVNSPSLESVKPLSDAVRSRFARGVLAVVGADGDKVSVFVTVSDDLVRRGLSANKILQAMMSHVNGRGGGNAASASGGGKLPSGAPAALASVPQTIASLLAA